MPFQDYESPKEGTLGNSPWSVKSLVNEFGLIMDYCATQKNKCTDGWCDLEVDGLKQQWVLNGWVNPPFIDQELWVRRALGQVSAHNITIVMLLNADTSSNYFQNLVMGIKADGSGFPIPRVYRTIRWINGRVKFWRDGVPLPKKCRPFRANCILILKRVPEHLVQTRDIESQIKKDMIQSITKTADQYKLRPFSEHDLIMKDLLLD